MTHPQRSTSLYFFVSTKRESQCGVVDRMAYPLAKNGDILEGWRAERCESWRDAVGNLTWACMLWGSQEPLIIYLPAHEHFFCRTLSRDYCVQTLQPGKGIEKGSSWDQRAGAPSLRGNAEALGGFFFSFDNGGDWGQGEETGWLKCVKGWLIPVKYSSGWTLVLSRRILIRGLHSFVCVCVLYATALYWQAKS